MTGERNPWESPRGELHIRGVATLLALAVLPFAAAVFGPLFADDYIHIERALALAAGDFRILLDGWVLRASDASAWWAQEGVTIDYFRPLVVLSFALDHALWGLSPWGYHLTNLALHVAVTLVVYAIASRLLRPSQAWAAAALFAVHPCHAEAVVWASARTDGLMTLFYAGAVLADIERMRRGSRWNLLLIAALSAAALLTKEMAITLPILLALLGWLQRRAEPGWWAGAAAAGLAAVAYLIGRVLLFGGIGPPPHPFGHPLGDPDLPWNVVGGLLLYLADLVLVAPVDPAAGFPLLTRFWPVLLAMAAVSAAILGWVVRSALDPSKHRSDAPNTGIFGLLWLGGTLLPVLAVSVGERFLYLPSVGLCLLVGAAVPPRWGGETSRRLGVAFLLVVALVTTGKVFVWGVFAETSRGVIDEALEAVDAHPEATLVAVVDLPAASALGFSHAMRLARPERGLEVELLSLAPHFLGPTPGFNSSVAYRGDRISIRADGVPYLESYIERAFRAEAKPLRVGERVRRQAFDVVIRDARGEKLRAFDVELHPGTAARSLVLRGEVFELQPLVRTRPTP